MPATADRSWHTTVHEENARRDQIRCIGASSLSARVADPPGQPRRHQRLMQIVPINLALDRKIRCIEVRAPGAAPFAVNPSTIDTDSERWSRRKKDQVNLLSTTLPPSSGCLELEKRGNIDSSATAGSSNESVPGKNLLPAMQCAWAECAKPRIAMTMINRLINTPLDPSPGEIVEATTYPPGSM